MKIKRITINQFAACYEALAMGSTFETVASMLLISAEEFELFIFNPAADLGFEAFQ